MQMKWFVSLCLVFSVVSGGSSMLNADELTLSGTPVLQGPATREGAVTVRTIRVIDQRGNPIPGAEARIFWNGRSTGGTTDQNGIVSNLSLETCVPPDPENAQLEVVTSVYRVASNRVDFGTQSFDAVIAEIQTVIDLPDSQASPSATPNPSH